MEFRSDIEVRLIQSIGGDHMIAAAAKVSTDPGSALELATAENKEGITGLINYLIKHRHGTPFEHSALTFFVRAPIFVWREWHRHRIGFSYNEESGRYKTLDPVFYLPPKNRPMFKVEDWKPGRPKFMRYDEVGSMTEQLVAEHAYASLIETKKANYERCYDSYLKDLNAGIDPGLARIDLPVGIYSSCWVTCNPRSLMAFLSLRTHDPKATFVSYPLYEIEAAAESCETVLAKGWPITYKAFCNNGRVGP